MTKFATSTDRDANRVPTLGDFPFRTKRSVTFLGATTDAWGNDGGALDDSAIFTVTGLVFVKVVAAITTSLTGDTSTLACGISGATTIFMPTETCTDMDAGQIWVNDAANGTYIIAGEEAAAADNIPEYLLNGNDIILTVGTANIEAGVIDFYALWRPVSDNGSIVATTT